MARTMTVALGDELWEYIESLIESGDYRTQSEVIRESLRLLREKQAESRLQVSCGKFIAVKKRLQRLICCHSLLGNNEAVVHVLD